MKQRKSIEKSKRKQGNQFLALTLIATRKLPGGYLLALYKKGGVTLQEARMSMLALYPPVNVKKKKQKISKT